MAGGADIILLPEIPYDIDKVVDAIHKRTKDGKGFTILAVAEGAISKDDAQLTKKQYKAKLHPAGIHRFLMRLQIRFRRNAVWKSALRFRATHSVAAVRVHTTEYYVPVLDLPLPKQLWMENLAA